MPREFELSTEIMVDATPEEVWRAITEGPLVDSWFMGRTTVRPGAGGSVELDVGGEVMAATITGWDAPHRLAYRTDVEPDGAFRAFEYLVEAREHGSTSVRAVMSGVLGGDDWQDEYDALSHDGPIYPFTLGAYLTYFRGRTAAPVTAFVGGAGDRAQFWGALLPALGLPGPVELDQPVLLHPAGLPPTTGIVDYLTENQLGVRTGDSLLRFVHGTGAAVIGHHLFDHHVDQPAAEAAWQDWLLRTFGPSAPAS